jgi:NAD(P)-dependent dehydrogenase (short-subunit alcohol dehydrogenase family)
MAAAAAAAPATLLTGKVAIVTGGTRNIGAGISKELASRGASVAMVYQNKATSAAAEAYARELEGLGGGVRAVAIQADLADAASPAKIIKATLEGLGVDGIDIVGTSLVLGAQPTTLLSPSLPPPKRSRTQNTLRPTSANT